MHCVLQTVLFAVQTITFMYTSTVISSAILLDVIIKTFIQSVSVLCIANCTFCRADYNIYVCIHCNFICDFVRCHNKDIYSVSQSVCVCVLMTCYERRICRSTTTLSDRRKITETKKLNELNDANKNVLKSRMRNLLTFILILPMTLTVTLLQTLTRL